VQSVFHGRTHFQDMFQRYNHEHRHRGLAMLTPATVHMGKVDDVLGAKQSSLDAAYLRHPERFPHGPPKAKRPSEEVWINRPSEGTATIISPQAERAAGVKPGEAGERRLYDGEHAGIILPDGSAPNSTEVLQ